MARRQDQDQFVGAEVARVQSTQIGAADEDAQVRPPFADGGHHLLRHLFLEFDLDLGVQLGVLGQKRRQELRDRRGAGEHLQVADHTVADIREFNGQVVEFVQDGHAALREGSAQRRGLEAARMPFEELGTERHLQVTEPPAGSGQHQVAFTGGLGQVTHPGAHHGQADGDEVEAGQVEVRRVHGDLRIMHPPSAGQARGPHIASDRLLDRLRGRIPERGVGASSERATHDWINIQISACGCSLMARP